MAHNIDMHAVRELEIYADNTRNVYFQNIMPTVENLRKKRERGLYDRTLAVKAWMYVANAAAKAYAAEFCERGAAWHKVFPASVRRVVADRMERHYYDEYIRQ